MEKLVHRTQKAYVKGRDISQAQLNVMSKIQAAMQDGLKTTTLCLDFKKAFDKMRHSYMKEMMEQREWDQC